MVSGGTQADSLQTYDDGNNHLLVRAQTAGTPLALTGGSIEGDITVRDGALAGLRLSVGTLADQLISQVNAVYSPGYDLNGNSGQPFFTGYNADSIAVNNTLLTDPSSFQASSAAGAAGDNTVVLALAQLANQQITSLSNQTLSGSYAHTVAVLGQAISSINDQVSSSNAVSTMLSTQRSTISGVSLDEEMTNLMQFQKAYQASAELISTVSQMLQTVINMKSS